MSTSSTIVTTVEIDANIDKFQDKIKTIKESYADTVSTVKGENIDSPLVSDESIDTVMPSLSYLFKNLNYANKVFSDIKKNMTSIPDTLQQAMLPLMQGVDRTFSQIPELISTAGKRMSSSFDLRAYNNQIRFAAQSTEQYVADIKRFMTIATGGDGLSAILPEFDRLFKGENFNQLRSLVDPLLVKSQLTDSAKKSESQLISSIISGSSREYKPIQDFLSQMGVTSQAAQENALKMALSTTNNRHLRRELMTGFNRYSGMTGLDESVIISDNAPERYKASYLSGGRVIKSDKPEPPRPARSNDAEKEFYRSIREEIEAGNSVAYEAAIKAGLVKQLPRGKYTYLNPFNVTSDHLDQFGGYVARKARLASQGAPQYFRDFNDFDFQSSIVNNDSRRNREAQTLMWLDRRPDASPYLKENYTLPSKDLYEEKKHVDPKLNNAAMINIPRMTIQEKDGQLQFAVMRNGKAETNLDYNWRKKDGVIENINDEWITMGRNPLLDRVIKNTPGASFEDWSFGYGFDEHLNPKKGAPLVINVPLDYFREHDEFGNVKFQDVEGPDGRTERKAYFAGDNAKLIDRVNQGSIVKLHTEDQGDLDYVNAVSNVVGGGSMTMIRADIYKKLIEDDKKRGIIPMLTYFSEAAEDDRSLIDPKTGKPIDPYSEEGVKQYAKYFSSQSKMLSNSVPIEELGGKTPHAAIVNFAAMYDAIQEESRKEFEKRFRFDGGALIDDRTYSKDTQARMGPAKFLAIHQDWRKYLKDAGFAYQDEAFEGDKNWHFFMPGQGTTAQQVARYKELDKRRDSLTGKELDEYYDLRNKRMVDVMSGKVQMLVDETAVKSIGALKTLSPEEFLSISETLKSKNPKTAFGRLAEDQITAIRNKDNEENRSAVTLTAEQANELFNEMGNPKYDFGFRLMKDTESFYGHKNFWSPAYMSSVMVTPEMMKRSQENYQEAIRKLSTPEGIKEYLFSGNDRDSRRVQKDESLLFTDRGIQFKIQRAKKDLQEHALRGYAMLPADMLVATPNPYSLWNPVGNYMTGHDALGMAAQLKADSGTIITQNADRKGLINATRSPYAAGANFFATVERRRKAAKRYGLSQDAAAMNIEDLYALNTGDFDGDFIWLYHALATDEDFKKRTETRNEMAQKAMKAISQERENMKNLQKESGVETKGTRNGASLSEASNVTLETTTGGVGLGYKAGQVVGRTMDVNKEDAAFIDAYANQTYADAIDLIKHSDLQVAKASGKALDAVKTRKPIERLVKSLFQDEDNNKIGATDIFAYGLPTYIDPIATSNMLTQKMFTDMDQSYGSRIREALANNVQARYGNATKEEKALADWYAKLVGNKMSGNFQISSNEDLQQGEDLINALQGVYNGEFKKDKNSEASQRMGRLLGAARSALKQETLLGWTEGNIDDINRFYALSRWDNPIKNDTFVSESDRDIARIIYQKNAQDAIAERKQQEEDQVDEIIRSKTGRTGNPERKYLLDRLHTAYKHTGFNWSNASNYMEKPIDFFDLTYSDVFGGNVTRPGTLMAKEGYIQFNPAAEDRARSNDDGYVSAREQVARRILTGRAAPTNIDADAFLGSAAHSFMETYGKARKGENPKTDQEARGEAYKAFESYLFDDKYAEERQNAGVSFTREYGEIVAHHSDPAVAKRLNAKLKSGARREQNGKTYYGSLDEIAEHYYGQLYEGRNHVGEGMIMSEGVMYGDDGKQLTSKRTEGGNGVWLVPNKDGQLVIDIPRYKKGPNGETVEKQAGLYFTPDMIKKDAQGNITIADWKSSGSGQEHAIAQMAFYATQLEELGRQYWKGNAVDKDLEWFGQFVDKDTFASKIKFLESINMFADDPNKRVLTWKYNQDKANEVRDETFNGMQRLAHSVKTGFYDELKTNVPLRDSNDQGDPNRPVYGPEEKLDDVYFSDRSSVLDEKLLNALTSETNREILQGRTGYKIGDGEFIDNDKSYLVAKFMKDQETLQEVQRFANSQNMKLNNVRFESSDPFTRNIDQLRDLFSLDQRETVDKYMKEGMAPDVALLSGDFDINQRKAIQAMSQLIDLRRNYLTNLENTAPLEYDSILYGKGDMLSKLKAGRRKYEQDMSALRGAREDTPYVVGGKFLTDEDEAYEYLMQNYDTSKREGESDAQYEARIKNEKEQKRQDAKLFASKASAAEAKYNDRASEIAGYRTAFESKWVEELDKRKNEEDVGLSQLFRGESLDGIINGLRIKSEDIINATTEKDAITGKRFITDPIVRAALENWGADVRKQADSFANIKGSALERVINSGAAYDKKRLEALANGTPLEAGLVRDKAIYDFGKLYAQTHPGVSQDELNDVLNKYGAQYDEQNSYYSSMARAMSYNSLMNEIDRRRSESGEETLQQTLDRIHAAPTPAVPTPAEPVPAQQTQPEPAPASTTTQTRQSVVIQTSAANRTPYEPTVFAGQPAPEQIKIPERVLTQEQVDSARAAMEQARIEAETAEKESQRAQNEYSTYQRTATEAQKNRADEIQKQQEATDNADAEVKRLTEERKRIQEESNALRAGSGTSALERTITPEQVQAARANMELAQANAISAQETAAQASQAYTGYQATVAQNQATRAAAISEQEKKAADVANANADVLRLTNERNGILEEEQTLNDKIVENERQVKFVRKSVSGQKDIEVPKYLNARNDSHLRDMIREDLLRAHPELYQPVEIPEEVEREKPTAYEEKLAQEGDKMVDWMARPASDEDYIKSVLDSRLGEAETEHDKRIKQLKDRANADQEAVKGLTKRSKDKKSAEIQARLEEELSTENVRYAQEQEAIRKDVADHRDEILSSPERKAQIDKFEKDRADLRKQVNEAKEKHSAYSNVAYETDRENEKRLFNLNGAVQNAFLEEKRRNDEYKARERLSQLNEERQKLTTEAQGLAQRKNSNAADLAKAQAAAKAAADAATESERLRKDDAEKRKAESGMLDSLKTASEQATADADQKEKDAKNATKTYTGTFKAFKRQERTIAKAESTAQTKENKEKELTQRQTDNATALVQAETLAQNAATATQALVTEDANKTKAENNRLAALKQAADQANEDATVKDQESRSRTIVAVRTKQAYAEQEAEIAAAEKEAKAQRAAEEEKAHRVARDAALRPVSIRTLQGSHATKAGQRDDIRAAIRLGSGLDQYVFGPDGTIQRIKTPKPDEAPTPQVIQVGSAPSQQPPASAAPTQQPQAGANAPTGTDASNNEAAGQTTEKPASTPFKFDRNWQETDKISESRVGQIQENAKAAAYNLVQEERKYYEELAAKTDKKTRNETWSASELDAFEKLRKRVDTKEAREATIGAYANYFAERQINAENLNATLGENRITAIDENSALAVKNMQLQYDQYHRNKRAQWIGRDAITRSMLEWQSRNESLASQQESLKTSMGQAGRNVEAKRTAWKNASAEEKAQREQEYKEAVANQSGLQAKYNAVTEEINKSSGPLGAATAAFNGLGTAISNVASRLGRRLFMNVTREITQFVKQFDAALTQIQMITMKSDDQMSQLGTTLISKAKELKISVAEISSTATALYRQGLSDEEVNERLETISKFSKVSGTKVDAATKLVTVAMNTGLVDSAGEAADIVTILGDSAATNAAEIEKGVEKSGAAAAADGTTFGQLAAMLTAITSTTQVGGNIAGRTLSTIMQRMNKVGTGELVYDENGNAVSGSSIAKLIEANGVDVYRNGKKRSTFDILYDLSQNWDSMSDAAKQQLSTNIAGRQYSNFSAIMQGMSEGDIDKYMELLEGSEGTVDKKFSVYEKSLAAGITNVKNAFDDLINTLTENGAIEGFFDGITTIIDGLNNLAKGFGGAATAAIPLIEALAGITMMKMGIATANPVLALGGLGLAAVGVGTAYFNGKQDTRTATEKYDQKVESVSSVYNERLKNASRLRELASKDQLSNEEKSEYGYLVDTLAAFSGLGDEAVSAAKNVETLSASASKLGESAKQAAQDIADAADKEAENEKIRKFYNEGISGAAESIAEEGSNRVNEFYQNEGFYQKIIAGSKKLAKKNGMSFPEAYTAEDFKNYFIQAGDLFGDTNLHRNMIAFAAKQSENNINLPDEYRHKDKSWWTANLHKTPDEVIQMMLDDARIMFMDSGTNSANKQKQGIIDRAKSVFTDLGLSGDYVDFAAQKLAEDYYNDPKIKEFLNENGYYPQVDSFVVEQLLAEAIGKDINPKGEKSVAESALKEYARKGGYADKAAWLEQLSLEDAGVGGYYIDEEGRRITAAQAEQRVNDYNNRLELERTEYQLAEADETGKAVKNGKVFGAYNWQTNGTTEDAEKAANAAKEQGVYYYTRQDGTIVDRDENGNLFTSEEARNAAQAASDASQELWQSTFYDPNTGITYKSKIGTKEEAANDESFIQLRQDIASKAFGLKTTAGDELFGDEYKFGSYVEAQAAAAAFNGKERERYATQMAAAKAEQQANTSASYVNAQGETVSFYGADAHAQAEAARNAELEKGGYAVYDEQGQYYTTAATEDEARQIYADNFMHYYDTYGNDYGVGSEGRANFEKAKQEYEANVDNYDYYVDGKFVGRGQEGKDLTEGLSEVYDIGTGETFYSREEAEKALAKKIANIEYAAQRYQLVHGASVDEAYNQAIYDETGSTNWSGKVNTKSANVEARLQDGLELDVLYENIADNYIVPIEQIVEGIQDHIPELANVDPAQLVNVYGQLPTEIQTMLTEASQTGEYTLDLVKTVNDALAEVPMPKLKTVKDHFRAGVSVGASAWDSKNSMAVTADNMLRMIESNGISNVVDLFKYVNENNIKQWSALNSNEEFGHLMDQYGFEIDENGEVKQTAGSKDLAPIKTLLMSMGRDYGKEALTAAEQGQKAKDALSILQNGGFTSAEASAYFAAPKRQEAIEAWEEAHQQDREFAELDPDKQRAYENAYRNFLKENHLTSDADYAKYLGQKSLTPEQKDYLKAVLGDQLAQRLFTSSDSQKALSTEDSKLVNELVNNAAYGVTGLTATQKLAGIQDVYARAKSGKLTGYSDIAASQYMAGFGQWSEYRMLKEKQEANEITPEELDLLKQYDVALDNFVKNSEIEIELKGLQELENAGELLEGTSALVEKLKKGGKFAIEAVVKLTTETYSQGQQSAMLQNGTLQQQHETAMSILGMSAEQFYQDAYGNTERARQIDQQNRELMAKSREEQWRAAMESGDTAAAQDIVNSMANAGFTSEIGEVEEEYTLEDAVRGKSGFEYGLAAARWLANGGKRKVQGVKFTDTGATNVDVINPALQEKENWTEKELATFGAGILGSTQFNATNAEEYTAAYNSLGFYGKDYLRQREQLKLTTQGALMSAEKELKDAKSVGGTTLEEAQAKVDELEKKITSLNNNEVPEELRRAHDLAVAEAELASRQADETDFAKNLTLENKLDETTAQEAAKNRTIFLYGTDSERYAATAGYQKNVRDLRNANYYLDHVNAQSSGVLAEYLGVDEQTVKESLKTDEGKNELRKAINDKAKKLFASMAEALGADLGDLNLETADLSAVKEAVTKAAEYLGEEEKNLLLSVAGVITDAGNVLGQKAQTVSDVFDDIIGESDAENSKKQAGAWLMDNYEQFTGQVASVEKQYDLPEGYTIDKNGTVRNASGEVDKVWTEEYRDRTPVYETRELSYQEAMQKYMDDNGIDFDVAGYFADNHAAGNLARMYDSGRLSGGVVSQYIGSTLYGNELAPQFYDNLAGDLFGNLYSNGQFDVSQAQQIKDMYESYITGENAANGGQEAIGLMDSKYGEFFKAIADAKTLDQAEEAIRALNEQMADDKAAAATKYAKGMSNVSQIISGLRKGGKDAAQAAAALNKNMKTYQDQMTAVSKAKDGKGNWKKGSQVKGQTRQILADWLGVDAKDVEKYTAEEMEEFFGGMEDAINKSATSDLNAIWQDKLAQIQEQFPTFDLSQIEINADGSINTKGLDEKVAAAINQAVAEMESYAGPLAELIFKLVAGEEGGLPKLNLEALVNKNGSGKYNGGGGGGGGGGESDAQKMLKRHKHEVTEAEHKVKMEEIYQTHYDFINDYDAYIDSLGKEEQAYADLSAVYERQIGELEGMMGSLEAYSDDWWSVKEALDAAKESLADVQNKIDAIETKRVDIIVQKQENEDKPTTQKQGLWEQKARGYQIRGQFESYAVSEGERIKEIEEQRKQNEEQIAELEKTLAETTEGGDAWLKARDQLWAMQTENATLANDAEEARRALATATVQQYQTDLENRLTPRNHVDNMLSTYGQLYQTNRQYDDYRAALTQQNEVGRENIGLYTQYRDQLIEYMATLEQGSEAWYAARDAIYQYDEAIAQATVSTDENNRAIQQSYVDQLKQKYEELNKDLTHTDNILKAQQDRYDKNNNFTMYQQVLSERLEVTRNKLAELETQLQGYLDLQGEITEGTDAWDALKESAQSTAEQIENAKNEEEELIRLQSQSKFEHDQEVFERQDNLDQHNLRMIQYEQTMYQNRGEYRNVNTMLEHENRLRAEMAQRTLEYIDVLKEDLALAEEGSDEYYKIAEAIYKAEENVKQHTNAIEKNTETMKKNEEQILKTHQTLINTIDNELKTREKERRERLAAEVNIQTQILNIIRNRYKQEWAIVKSDLDVKKKALQEEKALIAERLKARTNAEDREEKHAQLTELKRQLSIVSSDPTRTKDAKDLQKQIDDMEKEIARSEAQDEVTATQERLDEQMKAYDEFAAYQEQKLNEMLKDANSTQLWEEMSAAMGTDDMSREERIENYLDWIKQNDDNYKYGTEAMRMQLEQNNTDSWNKMLGWIETYWDEVHEIIDGGVETMIDFMKQSSAYQFAEEEASRKLMEWGWKEQFEDYENARKDDAEWNHDHDEIITQIDDEVMAINYGIRDMYGLQRQMYSFLTGIEYDYIRPTDVDPDAANSGYKDYAGVGRTTYPVGTDTGSGEGGGSGGGGSGSSGGSGGRRTRYDVSVAPNGMVVVVEGPTGQYNTYDEAARAGQGEASSDQNYAYRRQYMQEIADRMITSATRGGVTRDKYAEGGLVDYTGFAWVDGTLTRPESFLDAEDTANLKRLTDSLSYVSAPSMYFPGKEFFGNNSTVGDINIVINQAQINNDSDLDKLATEIGRKFTKQLSKEGLNLAGYAW